MGNSSIVFCTTIGVPASAVVGLFLWKYGLPGELQHTAALTVQMSISAVCILSAPVGFLLGHQLGITDQRTLRHGIGVWLVVVATGLVLTLGFSSIGTTLRDILFVECLLTLPIAPFALAPLAVAWNRHR